MEIQSSAYDEIEVRRDIGKRVEELIRAKASKRNKRNILRNCLENGFKFRRIKQAKNYLPNANRIVQHACDIYISQELMKGQTEEGQSLPEFYKSACRDFETLPENELTIYLAAALVDRPNVSTKVASNAFHNFMQMHIAQSKEQLNNNPEYNESTESNNKAESEYLMYLYKESKRLWNSMKAHQKFPFFLTGYVSTYYPRTIDGSSQEGLKGLSPEDIQDIIDDTAKGLKEIDAEKSTGQHKITLNSQSVSFYIDEDDDDVNDM